MSWPSSARSTDSPSRRMAKTRPVPVSASYPVKVVGSTPESTPRYSSAASANWLPLCALRARSRCSSIMRSNSSRSSAMPFSLRISSVQLPGEAVGVVQLECGRTGEHVARA